MSLLKTLREVSPKAHRLAQRQAAGKPLTDPERRRLERATARAVRLDAERVAFDSQKWVQELMAKGRGAGLPAGPSRVTGPDSSAAGPVTASFDARQLDRASLFAYLKAKGLTVNADVQDMTRDPVGPRIDPGVRALEEQARTAAVAAAADRRAKLAALPPLPRGASPEQVRARLAAYGLQDDGSYLADAFRSAPVAPPKVAPAGLGSADGSRREAEAKRAAAAKISRALLDSGGRSERRGGRSVIIGGSYNVRGATAVEERVLRELRGLAAAPW